MGTTVALLVLISANGDKATRLTDLEGRFKVLENKYNSTQMVDKTSNSTEATRLTDLEGRIKVLENKYNSTQKVNKTSNPTETMSELSSTSTTATATTSITTTTTTTTTATTATDTGAKVDDEGKGETAGNADSKNGAKNDGR